MTGSVLLPTYGEATAPDYFRNIGWFVESPRGPIAQYPPGAALLSSPIYALWNQEITVIEVTGSNRPHIEPIPLGIPPLAPAKLTAALTTAVAMGLVAATVPFAGGTRFAGVAAGYVGGLGTSMWSVAAVDLWQHGPAAMWVALGVYLAAKSELWWAGLAFGAAILTRPPTAIIVLVIGAVVTCHSRNHSPLWKLGLGSAAGLVAVLVYNWWLWGELTVSGGYGSGFTDTLVDSNIWAYLTNLGWAIVDPQRGLLVVSPFLAILVPGVRRAWANVPVWARGAALGALGYLLFVYKVNRFSGGAGFTGYRYPLEALTASASLLVVAYIRWVRDRPVAMWLFWIAVALAVVTQVM